MDYLNYQDDQLPVVVDAYVLREFSKQTKKSWMEFAKLSQVFADSASTETQKIEAINTFADYAQICLFYGLKKAHYIENIDFNISKQDIEMIIFDEVKEEFEEILLKSLENELVKSGLIKPDKKSKSSSSNKKKAGQ